jgi:hypothetical protein
MTDLATGLDDPVQRRRYWDETHLVTTLQGIVNREEPRLFVRYNAAPDDFWWKLMREPGGWMSDRDVVRPKSLEELLTHFASNFQGVIVYDERVPATSNLASTIAGVEHLLALRYDEHPQSLYQRIVTSGPKLPVVRSFITADGQPMFTGRGTIPGTALPSTGSAKNDAYRWLIEQYMKTGWIRPDVIGYYMDQRWLDLYQRAEPQNHTLNNHDYIIAKRGVLFDLSVWGDEVATDEPGAPVGVDYETLTMLLHALNEQTGGRRMIHAAGFVPWAFKYTNHAGGSHGDVESEWQYTEILSCFNAYKDADALSFSSFPNASFYMHFPLPDRIPQNPLPDEDALKSRGILDAEGRVVPRNYYAHYQGDYDAAAWMYWHMPQFWNDPARGRIPMTWPFNPNLAERFPLGMFWTRTTRTPNDAFTAGDSGAGYVNPYHLSEPRKHSGLPSGVAIWEEHCRRFYQQWDIAVTGFVIDGNTPGMTEEGWDAYARFSPGGIVVQRAPKERGLHNGTPYLRISGDLPGGATQEEELRRQAETIISRFSPNGTTFNLYRTVLKPPSHYVALEKKIAQLAPDSKRMLVDMPTLMWLIKRHEDTPRTQEELRFATAPHVSATPTNHEGLAPRVLADGVFTVSGDGWIVPHDARNNYFYLDVDDAFAESLTGGVIAEFEFIDSGTGRLLLQYDSTDSSAPVSGAYKNAAQEVQRTNSGKRKTARFVLPDPRFRGSQNGQADLRLFNGGEELRVLRVTITRGK